MLTVTARLRGRPRARGPLPLALAFAGAALAARSARAQEEAAPSGEEVQSENEPEGFVGGDSAPKLDINGYVDVGFADAQGDGSSFHPDDARFPADYGVDAFAPAVNSRGDVASADAGGRFTNGFLPRSVAIEGRPSFLLNTLSTDLRYGAPAGPVLVFSRFQLLPRLDDNGSQTRVIVEQAFGRLTPFASQELALFAGKFDSVFGIEYLEKEAPFRVGITPSLLARYTTGTSIGGKLFYRLQIAPIWSAFSLNVAATNSAPFVEALQPSEASLTGQPVLSGRLGYELNLPGVQVKLGGSGMRGPRNDQGDREILVRGYGADGRLYLFGLSLAGEYVHIDEDEGAAADKLTGAGRQTIPSGFHVRGFWAQLTYEIPWATEVLRKTALYARGEQRHAWFEGFTPVKVRRLTAGLRIDLWDSLALKFEMLFNREVEGAPDVDNDVKVASLVWTW
jgi:hypothetical protein